jgi:ferric-dicitrate binding protein FerR (iron transport regulator)
VNNEVFESLLSRVLDRDLSLREFAELEQHLTESPESRARYIEYVDLHAVLDLELQKAPPEQLVTSTVIDAKHSIRRQKIRSRRIALLPVAAILIIGLIAMQLLRVDHREPTLIFEASPGTQFTLTHSGLNEVHPGQTLEKGSRLQLSQGTVELTFKSGVTSIAMAPADMTLYGDDTLFLKQGRAWFQVPQGAEGFNVKTRELDIVDLGTEFGVFVDADGRDEVHVFKGQVEARALRMQKESTVLSANEAGRIDAAGSLTAVKAQIDTFLTDLPLGLPDYSGPIELTEGMHTLGTGGVAYTVSASLSVTDEDLENPADLILHAADQISIVFSGAVDLTISPPNIPASDRLIWNSDEDFGTLTLSGGTQPQVHDPNQEIEIESVTQQSFRWKFRSPNESKFRTPAFQLWRVNLHGIREFTISKDATSTGRAAFDIMGMHSSTQ